MVEILINADSITLVSAILGAVSAAYSVYSITFSRTALANKLKEARNHPVEEVLGTDKISVLGRFMDETIGEVDVSEYVASPAVAETIDRYFDEVIAFIGTDAETEQTGAPIQEVRDEEIPISESSPIVARVVEELETGEVWNALSMLRRLVEIELRKRAHALGFEDRHLRSARSIVRLLAERNYLADDIVGLFNHAISVCNRAVHGREVSLFEAHNAVRAADWAFRQLDVDRDAT